MIFTKKTRLEEYLVEILDKGTRDGPSLLAEVAAQAGPTTKQAMYKALRKLLQEEVINKQGTHYALNRVWLQKVFQFAQKHIQGPSFVDTQNILEFEEGDSVSYTFKNPFLLDLMWGHLYDILYEANPTEQAMLNYHPHEWIILSRPESEKFWLSRFVQDKKMMLFAIGNNSFLDKKFQKEYGSVYVPINLGNTYGLKPNQYLAVLGDYVFEVTTDMEFENRVNEFFAGVTSEEQINQKQITAISKFKYRSKLKLSKNAKKARQWYSRFAQDFYVPKPYALGARAERKK